jgi:predicted NBD/HSP70 family sugar kinase
MPAGPTRDHAHAASDELLLAALQRHGFRTARTFRDDAYRGLTHSGLAEVAGLSRPTVYAAEKALGAVLQDPDPDTGKRKLLRLRSDAGFALGVDIGTHHARVVLADFNGQLWGDRSELPIARLDERPERILKWVAGQVDAVLTGAQVEPASVIGVGVSRAAPINKEGKPHALGLTNKAWQDVNVQERLMRSHPWLEAVPVIVDNDSNLSALTEKTLGAGRELDDFVYVKWSDGLSIGLVLSGGVHRGHSGYAGEFGHLRESDHPTAAGEDRGELMLCPRCYKPDCLEMLVGAGSLLRAQLAAEGRVLEDDLVTSAAQYLWERIQDDDDEDCRRRVKEAADQLGQAVASIVDVLDPAALVLGGSLGTLLHDDAQLLRAFREGLEGRMMGLSRGIDIKPPRLHGRSAAQGAALRVLLEASLAWARSRATEDA